MNPYRALVASGAAAAFALGAAGSLGACLHRKEAAASHELPPYVLPPAVKVVPIAVRQAQGRTLFMKSCARCHGIDATGDEGPDLHGLEISDRRMATVVKRGIPGEMPSFAKKHDDIQVADLVAYVRSLD